MGIVMQEQRQIAADVAGDQKVLSNVLVSLFPELLGQWKQFLDQWIEAWSKVLGQAMGTEHFAKLMGQSLDQMLVSSAPAKKMMDQNIEQALQAKEKEVMQV